MINPLSKPPTEPFALAGKHGNVLLLHGYTGSPHDVLPLAEFLIKHGLGVHAPLLPGHGTQANDLNNIPFEDWLSCSEHAFDNLPRSRPKFVAGLSLGGLIATILAARHRDETTGLILLAPAYILRPIGRLAVFLAHLGLGRILPIPKKPGGGCDVADHASKAQNPCYKEMPIKGLVELEKTRKLAIQLIPKVECPTFAVFGQQDRTVDTNKSLNFLERFRTTLVEHHILASSRHVLPVDVDREHLAQLVLNFCQTNYEPRSKTIDSS